jgi:chaperonin GroES
MKKKIQKVVSKKKIKKSNKKVEIKKEIEVNEAPVLEVSEVQTVNNDYPIQPLQDRILIKEDNDSKEKTTSSGIIIPVTVEQDKNGKRGIVIAIGKGRYEEGKLIPVSVKVNDKVLFQWGDKVSVDGNEYYIVRESEILAILK